MATTMQNKKRFPVVPLLVFLVVFSGIIWYGYRHFVVKEAKPVPVPNGLNDKLPGSSDTKDLNKLEIYLAAEKDSALKKEQRLNDPYSKISHMPVAQEPLLQKYRPAGGFHFEIAPKDKAEPSERELDQKMEQIYRALHAGDPTEKKEDAVMGSDTVKNNNAVTVGADPELKQLEGMLDKLIDIQHPELVKERYRKKDSAAVVVSEKSLLKNTVTAVVHNTQVVSSGSTIKIRLTQDLVIGGLTIPKGSSLYGICTLHNERLLVQLANIPYQEQVIPVSLSVYDVDGIEGINIPGNITRDVAKEGTEQAISSFNLNGYDPTLTGQVASAGLQATKALLSKKVKLVRVTVKAGHHILLQNTHSY